MLADVSPSRHLIARLLGHAGLFLALGPPVGALVLLVPGLFAEPLTPKLLFALPAVLMLTVPFAYLFGGAAALATGIGSALLAPLLRSRLQEILAAALLGAVAGGLTLVAMVGDWSQTGEPSPIVLCGTVAGAVCCLVASRRRTPPSRPLGPVSSWVVLGSLAAVAAASGLSAQILQLAPKPPRVAEPDPPVMAPVGIALPPTALCVQPVDFSAKPKNVRHPLGGFTVFPGSRRPLISPLGGGQRSWTLDETGRYLPYDGAPFAPFGLNFATEKSGRVIAIGYEHGVDGGLFADTGTGFRQLFNLRGGSLSIVHNPRLDLTLVSRRREIFVLKGDTLKRWGESAQFRSRAGGDIKSIHDLPHARAMLFETFDRSLLLRLDEGGWARLPPLKGKTRQKGQESVIRVSEAPRIGMVVVNVQHRTLGVVIHRSRALVSTAVVAEGQREDRPVIAQASGDLLRLRSSKGERGLRLERYRHEWEAVAGDSFKPIPVGGSLLSKPAASLGGDILTTTAGLGLYDGGKVRLLNRDRDLGNSVEAVPTTDGRGMVLSTRAGMRMAAPTGVEPLAVPFTSGGLPLPLLGEKRSSGVVLALAREGLFSIDAQGRVERIPGGEAVGFGFGTKFVAELPVTGDVVLSGPGGVFLVKAANSCAARAGHQG